MGQAEQPLVPPRRGWPSLVGRRSQTDRHEAEPWHHAGGRARQGTSPLQTPCKYPAPALHNHQQTSCKYPANPLRYSCAQVAKHALYQVLKFSSVSAHPCNRNRPMP
eukprot:gene23043-biopygen16314